MPADIEPRIQALLGPYGDNQTLYDETVRLVAAVQFPDTTQFGSRIIAQVGERCKALGIPHPHDAVRLQMGVVAATALGIEKELINRLPPNPGGYFVHNANAVIGQLRQYLIELQVKVVDFPSTLKTISDTLVEGFVALARHLPPLALGGAIDHGVPTLPLRDLLPDLDEAIEDTLNPFYRTNDLKLFRWMREKPDEAHGRRRPKQDTLKTYITGTLFEALFNAPIPFEISLEDRGEHTAIVAGTGWGKTQLLQNIIASDIDMYEEPPGIVVIDSTGAMVQSIQRLAVFNNELKDKLLIIDPRADVPALNMFDISESLARSSDPIDREAKESEVIDLFNYVFSSVDNQLTPQQATPFAFMVRLLLSMPGANLDTLQELLQDNPKSGYVDAQPKFREAIERLDPTSRNFFQRQFYGSTSDARRDQITQRILAVTKVPAFQRMFSTINKIDFYTELNRGAIILVNTSESLLKESSATFGRYIVARCMAAAFERESIPRDERRQAFLIIDEAAPYFDDQFEKLLTRVRQFKLGVVVAFQHLEQASQKVRSAIASSTAVKYAGGVGAADARWLANEMRVDADFILAQKRDSRPPKWSQFACHVRGFTDKAVSLTVPFFTLDNMPKMSDAEHAALLVRNRARVSAPISLAPATPPATQPSRVSAPPAERTAQRRGNEIVDDDGSNWPEPKK